MAQVAVQPANAGLVQLPIIFHTDPLGSAVLQAPTGIPATITAIPHYVWSFGDQRDNAGAADSPQAYVDGLSPRDTPGAYITHTYTTNATYQVTLTIRWEATFTVAGVAAVQPLNPVAIASPAVQYQVLEAKAVLTGNG